MDKLEFWDLIDEKLVSHGSVVAIKLYSGRTIGHVVAVEENLKDDGTVILYLDWPIDEDEPGSNKIIVNYDEIERIK